MSDTTTQAETTEERTPPTIADIVREKTGDGRLIIDFFTDVMTGRIEGAELCHRIDAAKQLVKYGSKDAAEFIAKYKGVPCGHSTRRRPNQADPCSAEERTLVAVTLNAPPALTREFLTVLSGIDEFLMARLIRAQTAHGDTIIEFLDDVMQDRNDGFKTHHRIAAAKELIVHIIRDEQPAPTPSPSTRETDKRGDSTAVGADPRVRPLPGSHTPSPSTGEGWGEGDSTAVGADPRVRPLPGSHTPSPLTGEGWGEGDSPAVPAQSLPRTRYGAGTQGGGGGRSTAANPARAEPVLSTAEGSVHPEPREIVVPAQSLPRTRYGAGTQGGSGARSTAANPAHPEPSSTVIPAKAGIQGGGGGRNTPANPARTEPVLSTVEGSAHPEPSSTVVPAHTTVVPAEAGTHPVPLPSVHPEPVEGPRPEFTEGPADSSSVVPAKEPAEGRQNYEERKPRTRRTRTQRRRDGSARAAALRKDSERRINEKLEQHWHEPDPYGAPIDSTHPGRSPPW